MNVLILGGTTEASDIARGLAGDPAIRAVLSLAGRTRAPALPAVAARRGGFGGVDGLVWAGPLGPGWPRRGAPTA